MHYKRTESFRYTFGTPLEARIEIFRQEADLLPISTGQWEASILDISPNGMKIISSKNIQTLENLQIQISFILNETPLDMTGTISWKKPTGTYFEYGILENNSLEIKNLLISELKVYSRNNLKKS